MTSRAYGNLKSPQMDFFSHHLSKVEMTFLVKIQKVNFAKSAVPEKKILKNLVQKYTLVDFP